MPNTFEINNQDSTTIKINPLQIEPQQSGIGTLEISRKTIELSSFDKLIETPRIRQKVKKTTPIIKIVPYISENDSLPAPNYNTFTGEFEMPIKPSQWDNFHFTPFDPQTNKEHLASKKAKINQETSTTKLIPAEDLLVFEQNEIAKGFGKTDWMLGILIVAFVLFGWINVKFSRFVQSVVSASYNYFAARRLQDEGNVVRSKAFTVMNILFFVNSALLVTQWFEFNNIKLFGQSGYILFFIVIIAIILMYSFKSLILLLLDFIFLTRGSFIEYNSTVFIYNKIYGFALLPLITCIPFVPENIANYLLFISLFAFGILYIMRLLRGIVIGFKNRLSILYLILYLCALEILPLLVLYHSIVMYI